MHGSQPQNQGPKLSYTGAVQSPAVSNKVTKMPYMQNKQRNQSSSRVFIQDNRDRNLPFHLDSGPSGTHTLELSESSQKDYLTHIMFALINIQGLITKRNNKLQSDELKNVFNTDDIICFTETWGADYFNFAYEGFTHFDLNRTENKPTCT